MGEAGIITTIAGEAVVEEVEVIKTKMEAIKPRIFITIPINNSTSISTFEGNDGSFHFFFLQESIRLNIN